MASTFYVVYHEFKPGKAGAWWDAIASNMSDQAAWEANVKAQFDMGFFNHSFNPITAEGPIYCIWEVRDGISAEAFQEFIDGPNGVNFGLNALNNCLNQVNTELTGGQTPYPRKFT